MINIYHSRRGKFKECKYWLRDERDSVGDLTQYVLKNQPTGIFYAQETTALTNGKGQVNNLINYDESLVNIASNDEISDIKAGCIVEYLHHAWLVVNVQQEIHLKESEFCDTGSRTTYLSLRR